MIRLLLLSICGVIIFAGFGLPFVIEGATGLLMGGLVILVGSTLSWFIEIRTKKSLEEDSPINNMLKADGENLVERE